MTVYAKVQKIKVELNDLNLKKSGKNKFAGFSYYELSDFLPSIAKLCDKHKVFTQVSFTNELASLKVFNSEKPDEVIEISSPIRELNLISEKGSKKMNELQGLGSEQTYQRRYLFMCLFDIVEDDALDSTIGGENAVVAKPTPTKAVPAVAPICENCSNPIIAEGKFTVDKIIETSINKFNKKYCINCAKSMTPKN